MFRRSVESTRACRGGEGVSLGTEAALPSHVKGLVILRECCGGLGEGSRAIAGFFGGAAHGTDGRDAEKPTNREGRGGDLVGADFCGSFADCVGVSSFRLGRLAVSNEEFDVRCVVSRGDLVGGCA